MHDCMFTALVENERFDLKRGKMETNLEQTIVTRVRCLNELAVSKRFLLPPPPLQKWMSDTLKQRITENSESITELEECLKGSV